MFKLTCLSGCGFGTTAQTRTDVGVRVMEHMADEHGIPVDPLEAGELALEAGDFVARSYY